MYDNYNYPMGADTPDAPWNEVEVPEIEVKCVTTMPMQKTISVYTDQYEIEYGDRGEEEGTELLCGYADLENMVKDQHYDIPTLLDELAKYIKGELESGNLSYQRKRELKDMLDDCQGWEEGDIEVEDYEIQ